MSKQIQIHTRDDVSGSNQVSAWLAASPSTVLCIDSTGTPQMLATSAFEVLAGAGTLSLDGTFVGNSDTLYPSQKAAKTYVDTVALAKSGGAMTGTLTITAGTAALAAVVSDAGLTTLTTPATVGHSTSGTPGVGFGSRLQFSADDNGGGVGTLQIQNRIESSWTDPAHATRTSLLQITTQVAGVSTIGLQVANGQILSSGGVLAAPGFAFRNEVSTGLYFINTGQVALVASGVQRIKIDSVGVGIGVNTLTANETVSILGARVAIYNTWNSSTDFERLAFVWQSNFAWIWTQKGSGGGIARDLVLGADGQTQIWMQTGAKLSFFAANPVVKQTGGTNVTNNVTNTASTDGTIPDITNGTVYATDYTNLRNALYQIARLLKQDHDALRLYGLLT